MSTDHSAEAPWRAGLRGVRSTVVPGLFLQAAALTLVLAYHHHEPTRSWLVRLAEFRESAGTIFAIVSTGMVGGVIPLLYLRSREATRSRYSWSQGAGLILFWAYKGAEVEWLYRFLAWWIGERVEMRTIATKTFIDQFLYCPLFAVPVTVLVYAWIDARFRLTPVAQDWQAAAWYRRRVLPLLIPNMAVWIPAVAIIYALPTALQLPLQNVVLCFYTLLLAHVTQEAK